MIDQFLKQFANGVEQAAAQLGKLPAQEIQLQLQAIAKSTLSKMDLVSREEFEVQATMLAKYRERVQALEARVKALEESQNDKQA